MHFTPLTENELHASDLLPEGTYQYKVIKSEDKISYSGNEYIALTLKITDKEARDHLVFGNLSLIKLLKHFCDVNNMQDQYKSGEIYANLCQNKVGGRVVIGIEGEKPNPSGGVFRAKNIVKDYVYAINESKLMPLQNKDDFINDVIPF